MGNEMHEVFPQNLNSLINKNIRVKFFGGKEIHGILKGYDHLMNLVIDYSEEYQLENIKNTYDNLDSKRKLGLIIIRGNAFMMLAPANQFHETINPFYTET